MRILAIIFDFNGVLVDDERVHFQAFKRTLAQLGMELSWSDYCEKYLHYGDIDFFRHFLDDQGESADLDPLIDAKSRYYFQEIENQIPAVDSTVDFIRELDSNIFLAIASAASRREIEFILERLHLLRRFRTLVAAEDVANGKPHPEAFNKALAGLRRVGLDLATNNVLVVEDSYRGIDSAHAAGLKCVALSTSYPEKRLGQADLVLESLEGWTLQQLEASL